MKLSNRVSRFITCLLCTASALLLQSCESFVNVKAWEKGHLADRAMRLDVDVAEQVFLSHTYFSKEASSGGSGIGGGGCGCN